MLTKIIAILLVFQLSFAQGIKNRADTIEVEAHDADGLNLPLDVSKQLEIIGQGINVLDTNVEKVISQQNDLETRFQALLTKLKGTTLATNGDIGKIQNSQVEVKPLRAYIQSDNISENAINTRFSEINDLPANCAEALRESGETSGRHMIKIPNATLQPFEVYCFEDLENERKQNDSINGYAATAWTSIQQRIDGSVDFYRDWTEYKQGFGNIEGEFWIGLDKLHALTKSTPHELWIEMESFDGIRAWAMYSSFAIGNEESQYTLQTLGHFLGSQNTEDSLRTHVGNKFSTFDHDNDRNDGNCAVDSHGAWWYTSCYDSNLNGKYYTSSAQNMDGIIFKGFTNANSLKEVRMAIRTV